MDRIQRLFCVLKTRTLENYSLRTAMRWGFKSSDLPRRRSNDKDICDSVVMRVRFLWFSQTTAPQDGPCRTGATTSFTRVCRPKTSDETRTCCKGRSRSLSLFYCIRFYSIIFVVFHCTVQVHLQGEKNTMTLNSWWSTSDFSLKYHCSKRQVMRINKFINLGIVPL